MSEKGPAEGTSTSARKAVFLEHLALCQTIGEAASLAGVSRDTIYAWRNADAGFAAELASALERSVRRHKRKLQSVGGSFAGAAAKQARQDRFLETLITASSIEEAAGLAGVSRDTVYTWRHDPTFARRMEKVMGLVNVRKSAVRNKDLVVFDPFRAKPVPPPLSQFRRDVFGFPSTATQAAFCRAYDDLTNLVIFWVAPAGGGKDVTAMHAVAHAAAAEVPRLGVLCENEGQAKKRIDSYLDPYFTDPTLYTRAPDIPGGTVPTTNFIEDWGPWRFDSRLRLPDGTKPPQTKWEAHNKWFVGRATPMADPSLWAVGLGSSIAGSRVQLMVCSDLFTVENQRNPGFRKDQLDLINGTLASRFDEAGRLIFLNHHVGPPGASNLIELMETYIAGARVISRLGDYTKYSNGVATIITPALTVAETGELTSYWPARFPIRDTLILGDRRFIAADLTHDENKALAQQGARRIRGLVETRQRIGDGLFNLIYQQSPESSAFGDFTTEVLDGCDDPTRSFGMSRPGEMLIQGVDPARSGGAAWVMWAVNGETGIQTVVDFWAGEGLGFTGMRSQLIAAPVEQWRPRYLVWEDNYEGETPLHPDAAAILRRFNTTLKLHHTGHNRTTGTWNVISMLDDMRDGLIRFPAATESDRLAMRRLKEHFMAFESGGYTERKVGSVTRRRLQPDDGCMAAWIGWRHGKVLLKSRRSARKVATIGAARSVTEAFAGYRN